MSDVDTRRSRRRSYDRSDQDRKRETSRERKRHRSRSPSTDRYDKYKRRPRSPLEDRHDRSEYSGNHQSRARDKYRDTRRDDYNSRRRSKSIEDTKHRKRRSRSRDHTNGSYKHDEDKQLVRTRHDRDSSRDRYRQRRQSVSRSPPRKAVRKSSRSPTSHRARGPLPSQQAAFSANRGSIGDGAIPGQEKQKPNYGTSGKLAAETNTVKIGGEAIVLKYHEPPEARKPPSTQAWRMYEFKGDNPEPLSTTELGSRSCWLFGRETAVVDFLIEHPSCSKQHAVIQFRYVEKRSEFGDKIGSVKPYILDLESANGTSVNGEKIPDRRYMELKSGDSVGFGESTREYVILLPPKGKTTT